MFDNLESSLVELQSLYKVEEISESTIIKTGYKQVDDLTGGGYPRGRIVEIFGKESSAKTYLVLKALEGLPKDCITIFIDTDRTFSNEYLEDFGIDIRRLILIQPESGNDLIESLENIIRSGIVDLIIIDSIAAILSDDAGDAIEHLKYISKLTKKISALVGRYNCGCLFTNQVRDDGSKQGISTGGKILKAYAAIRLNTERLNKYIEDKKGNKVGEHIKVTQIKNTINKKHRTHTIIEIRYT